MKLQKELVELLKLAYSAERAAAIAYQGHAGSVKNLVQKKAIRRIEQDEWEHREIVLGIMHKYNVPVSKWLEFKYKWIGRFISLSCYLLGFFIPTYFAGRIEADNANEYFRMQELFSALQIEEHKAILIEMGEKEVEHELYLGELVASHWLLPIFKKVFKWSPVRSAEEINMVKK